MTAMAASNQVDSTVNVVNSGIPPHRDTMSLCEGSNQIRFVHQPVVRDPPLTG